MKIGKKVKTVTAPQREIRKVQPEPERYPVKIPYRVDWGVSIPNKITHVTGVGASVWDFDFCDSFFVKSPPPEMTQEIWDIVFANEPSDDELEQINQNAEIF